MEFTLEQPNPRKNLSGLALVALLHVALIYALATKLGCTLVAVEPTVADVALVKPEPKVQPRERPAKEEFDVKQKMWTPAPVILTDFKWNDPTPMNVTVVDPGGPDITIDGDRKKEPVRVAAVVKANACERPDYPSSAVRDSLEGTTTLAFLIGTNGRVMDAKIEKSSGSKALDNSAVAGLSRCAFKPGTVDGIPQQSWTKIEYVWRLE